MLLKNRAFLALLAGLFFLVLTAVFPQLPFSEEQVAAFIGLLAAYVVGEGLEGWRILENFKDLFKSRKFLAVVAGLIVIVVQAFFPNFAITADQLSELFILLSGLILGTGAEGLVDKLAKQ